MGRRQGGAGRGRLRAARSEDFLNRWPWSTLMIVIMTRTETNAIPGAGLILGGGRRPGWGTARGIICQGGMSDNYGNNTTYKWLWWTPANFVWADANDLDSIFRPSMRQLFQTWLPRFLTSSTGWLQQRVGEDCHGRGEGECSSISGSTAQLHAQCCTTAHWYPVQSAEREEGDCRLFLLRILLLQHNIYTQRTLYLISAEYM